MKVFLSIVASACLISHATGAVICTKDVTACTLYLNEAGSLVDRRTGSTIVNIGNLGAFSDASIYKYGSQYALAQENHSNDRLVTVIPLSEKNNKWFFNNIYYFSVSLAASSVKYKSLWMGEKSSLRRHQSVMTFRYSRKFAF
jgi:dolichyl-phosphate-mannose--protein O-mannosyl transferase